MQVFPGGSGNLEALPGVGRAAVQQLRPGDVVLAWDADLPVAIDHKLGAAILEGWKREMEGSGGLVFYIVTCTTRLSSYIPYQADVNNREASRSRM